jgi:hypothetical protein
MFISGSEKPEPIGLVHIPKTGGTTIVSSPLIKEFGHCMAYHPDHYESRYNYLYMGHAEHLTQSVTISLDELAKYYVFSVVRNPFNWLISYADWCSCFTNWNPDHYDAPYAKKGFEYFIRHIMNRDDRWPCRKFIHCQLFTPTGELVPDHILHTEHLDVELAHFFMAKKKVWVPPTRKQVGRAKLRKKRPSIDELYKDERLVHDIYECWGDEFRMLGYTHNPFDPNHYPAPAIISGAIEDKSIVRYIYDTNDYTMAR